MSGACTAEADTGLLHYAVKQLADLYTADPQGLDRGYASRRELFDSAQHSYRLFQGESCPVCGGTLGGEFRLLYRRTRLLPLAGSGASRWHRALDVQLECPDCGYERHNVVDNGPLHGAVARPGAIAISRC